MSAERSRTCVVRACSAALLLALLAGCGGSGEPERELDIPGAEGSSEPTPSATADGGGTAPESPPGVPSPSAPPREGQKVRDDDSEAYALSLPASGPPAQAGQALVDYMNVRLTGYNTGSLDLPALSAVAVGDPLQTVQARMLELQQEGLRTVGDIWVDMADEDVTVRGRTASFEGVCFRNASVDVDRRGVAVESPPSSYLATGRAQRLAADLWLIDQLSFESVPEC